MNEDRQNSLLNNNSSTEVLQNEAETSGGRTHGFLEDEQSSPYGSFYWFYNFTKKFAVRIINDMVMSFLHNWFPNTVPLPYYLEDLLRVYNNLRAERELHTVTYSRNIIYPRSPKSTTGLQKYGDVKEFIDFIHRDEPILMAAEAGDVKMLEQLVKSGIDVNVMDHIGRNALHFAVLSGNRHAVIVLLNAGVDPNVEDDVGMTPLTLCLMRRPSWRMASLLFEYGARIIARSGLMDTGLFIQFVMMCKPTKEEEKILHLLIEKGYVVDDPDAPGKRQALHFAAMSNNCQLIKILIELGADLFSRNHRYETPKDVAATFNCKEAYTLLEELENDYLPGNLTRPTVVADNASST